MDNLTPFCTGSTTRPPENSAATKALNRAVKAVGLLALLNSGDRKGMEMPDLCAKMKLTRMKGEVHRIICLMRIGEMDEFKSMEAIDAYALARDLREAADRIESVAKDYRIAS